MSTMDYPVHKKLGRFYNHLVCCVYIYCDLSIYVYIYICCELNMSRNSLDCVSKIFVQLMSGFYILKFDANSAGRKAM